LETNYNGANFGRATITARSPSVRRDLEEVVAQNLVKRTHGGVMSTASAKLDAPVLQRGYVQAEEKCYIGKAAAQLVQDGETIFLGSGSTVLAVAKNLRGKKNLTVISNSLPIINLLAAVPGMNIISIGGFLRQQELSLIGHLAETTLAELRVAKVIISIQGLHLQHGLTNNDLTETMTDRAICRLSSKLIIVADHSKFHKVNASFVADIGVIDTLITAHHAPADFLDELTQRGITVMLANGANLPEI
jgi:DeoR family transcriptional regulator, aga operon transcriptional repressor